MGMDARPLGTVRPHPVLQARALALENPARAAYASKGADYRAALARYAGEKQEIQTRALQPESQRDAAKQHGKPAGQTRAAWFPFGAARCRCKLPVRAMSFFRASRQ